MTSFVIPSHTARLLPRSLTYPTDTDNTPGGDAQSSLVPPGPGGSAVPHDLGARSARQACPATEAVVRCVVSWIPPEEWLGHNNAPSPVGVLLYRPTALFLPV